MRGVLTALAAVLGIVGAPAPGRSADRAGEDFFENHVRPVLTSRCVSCHGPKATKGGLRLDSREAVLRGGDGGSIAEPGKPASSRLLQALRHADPELKMPPDGKLPDAEIAAVERWITLGLPWPDRVVLTPPETLDAAGKAHWAFQPVRRPPVPSTTANPIDAFVRAKLAGKGLTPSPEADRRTLIRRLTFDLTGLPPTPAELAAFESDRSPEAYEKLVDRLLTSPRYGERWARHWLDVARYADNKGYVFFEDKDYPWAWTYRDYVINALNADKPFDRFVLEQLAADQLPLDDPKNLAALGFLTVGGHFMNSTHDIIDDRIDVVTRGLMGLTVQCARCHDHKYDPIPAADYYSLYGVFRSCTEPAIPPLWGPAPDTGDHKLFDAELKVRERELVDFVTAKHRDLVTQARARAAEYLTAAHATRDQPPADDFMLLADRGDLNPSMVTRWRAFLEETRKRKDPAWAAWHRYARLPEADFAARARKVTAALSGDDTVDPLVRNLFTAAPSSMSDVAARYGKLLVEIDQRWRETVARQPAATGLPHPAAEELRQALYGPLSPADAPMALDWGFLSLFPDRATQAEYQKLLKSVESWAAKGPPRSMVLLDSPRPYDPRVFIRGRPNRPGEQVPRQSPQVANPNRKPFTSGSGRLELAREIASKDNPLTARVFVNRVWMHHFGAGLVATPSDFGLRSEPPTHPELLDWLAAEFADTGWSVKRLHRLIVTSAAYRQASRERPEAAAVDPDNRLLWRANRHRLEFESLHDSILAVAGSLDLTTGGPPVPLFGKKSRRAVYGYIDRLEFPTLLTTFDVPNPATSSPERTNTTVAPQALYLMNGPFARTAAKRLVLSATWRERDPAARLDLVYLTLFARRPTPAERDLASEYLAKGPQNERWVDLVHGLLMTNEFTFID